MEEQEKKGVQRLLNAFDQFCDKYAEELEAVMAADSSVVRKITDVDIDRACKMFTCVSGLLLLNKPVKKTAVRGETVITETKSTETTIIASKTEFVKEGANPVEERMKVRQNRQK